MGGRIVAIAALAALASCAGIEPAGRNASRAPAPPPESPAAVTAAPAPAQPAPQPVQAAPPAAAPSVAAPAVTAPATQPGPAPRSAGGGNDIVVRGAQERQIQPPQGDNRSTIQRNEDIRAWDQCVTQVQSAYESDPLRPQLDTPEEYCRRSLGMADRLAVPDSRRQR